MVSLVAFKPQIELALQSYGDSYCDPRQEFLAVLRKEGYRPPDVLVLDKIMTFPAPGDTGSKKKGWAVYHEILDDKDPNRVIGVGVYDDWKACSDKPTKWVSGKVASFSEKERAEFNARLAEQNRLFEEAKIRAQQEAAATAFKIYNAGLPCEGHVYLERKKVGAYDGLKIAQSSFENEHEGDLIIPMFDEENTLWSLQFISNYGNKLFMTGGKKKGCFYAIFGKNDTIYVCEGYTTAASVHEATGNTTYVAFGVGNLYNVCATVKKQYPQSRIIIAGDEDLGKPVNAGRMEGEKVARGLGLECKFPQLKDGGDWNDLAVASGIQEVKKQLEFVPQVYEKKDEKKEGKFSMEPPPGALRDIYDYFNCCSGNNNYIYALATALAICSVILGRRFWGSYSENYTSLYFLVIGKSGTGKDYCNTAVNTILTETGHGELISGDGYTSAGAVFTALGKKPKHIAVIDEFGRNMEAAKRSGDALYAGANTKLMTAIGSLHSSMSAPTYSKMGLTKDKRNVATEDERIHRPAITMLAMSVPDNFYGSLDAASISSGFLGRFLVCHSDAERPLKPNRQIKMPVPECIKEWVRKIYNRIGPEPDLPGEIPTAIEIKMTQEAADNYLEYYEENGLQYRELEKLGIEATIGRMAEFTLRVALIVALARDANTDTVTLEDYKWARMFVDDCAQKLVRAVKDRVADTSYEAKKKEFMVALRARGEQGVTTAELNKIKPFKGVERDYVTKILEALKEAELAFDMQEVRNNKMTKVWRAAL